MASSGAAPPPTFRSSLEPWEFKEAKGSHPGGSREAIGRQPGDTREIAGRQPGDSRETSNAANEPDSAPEPASGQQTRFWLRKIVAHAVPSPMGCLQLDPIKIALVRHATAYERDFGPSNVNKLLTPSPSLG